MILIFSNFLTNFYNPYPTCFVRTWETEARIFLNSEQHLLQLVALGLPRRHIVAYIRVFYK